MTWQAVHFNLDQIHFRQRNAVRNDKAIRVNLMLLLPSSGRFALAAFRIPRVSRGSLPRLLASFFPALHLGLLGPLLGPLLLILACFHRLALVSRFALDHPLPVRFSIRAIQEFAHASRLSFH